MAVMRKFVMSLGVALPLMTSAYAADIPRRAPPPPVFTPVPVFTWTGGYIGINAGYAWSDNQNIRSYEVNNSGAGVVISALNAATVRSTQVGFTAGGQAGYNYQFTPGAGVVVGIEADAAYTDLDRRRALVSNAIPGFPGIAQFVNTNRQGLDFLGTVRGRIGYAFDRVLVYGIGGFAYGNVRYDTATSLSFAGVTTPFAGGSYDKIETGFAYGGGIEYALPTDSFLNFFRSSAVIVKAEYLHYDLGRRNVSVFNLPVTAPLFVNSVSQFRTEGNIARVGLNYKFGSY